VDRLRRNRRRGVRCAPGHRARARATGRIGASPLADVGIIGFSAEGQPIEAYFFDGHEPGVIIVGSIHGNEPRGAILCEHLVRRLRDGTPADRRVVVVPKANPDGMLRRHRENARGVDLNRNFPAGSFRQSSASGPEPLSEPESRALHDLVLTEQPGLVISIHEPLGVVDYDGPAREWAHCLAERIGLPVRRLGARAGSLGAWVGEVLGLPIVTLELPRGAGRTGTEASWEAFASALLEAIAWPEPAAK
jgi:protein MpaA